MQEIQPLKMLGKSIPAKTPKVLIECNGYPEMFNLSGAVEISRWYLLIRTDILQKTVVGCPCILEASINIKRKFLAFLLQRTRTEPLAKRAIHIS